MYVVNPTTNGAVTIKDVKRDRKVYRLWKNGGGGKEYFLLENRQRTLYGRKLPGEGLLVYHVDEAIDGNDDENHPFIKLLEADGLNDLHDGTSRGDPGDPYPGQSKNATLTNTSNPDAKSYGAVDTCVTVTSISRTGASMTARLGVRCGGASGPVQGSKRKAAAQRTSGKRATRRRAPVKKRARKSARRR